MRFISFVREGNALGQGRGTFFMITSSLPGSRFFRAVSSRNGARSSRLVSSAMMKTVGRMFTLFLWKRTAERRSGHLAKIGIQERLVRRKKRTGVNQDRRNKPV